jgi:N-carbamoyl-L-amino-acid hydrolase
MKSTSSGVEAFRPEAALLHGLLRRFGKFGAQTSGGITRLCATPADGEARHFLVTWLKEQGAELRIDAVGNIYGIFNLAGPDAPLVMAGSHLDSQINAGRLDGTYGVAAACCAAQALLDARRAGASFEANLCIVNWTNEEGARFRPSLLGSGYFAGEHDTDYALSRTDDAGFSVGQALEAIGFRGSDPPPRIPIAYLELHIEQGALLAERSETIGIVLRNWGAVKLEVAFLGEQAHTGPCPMERRRDALLAASHAVIGIRDLADSFPGALHTSAGRIVVSPNSANVVPARTELSIELRSTDEDILTEATHAARPILLAAAANARTELRVISEKRRRAVTFPIGLAETIEQCAVDCGYSVRRMETVSGHDALSLLNCCPTGLIFVPSIDGLSHNAAEDTDPSDLEAGLNVFTLALSRLCRRGTQAFVNNPN